MQERIDSLKYWIQTNKENVQSLNEKKYGKYKIMLEEIMESWERELHELLRGSY